MQKLGQNWAQIMLSFWLNDNTIMTAVCTLHISVIRFELLIRPHLGQNYAVIEAEIQPFFGQDFAQQLIKLDTGKLEITCQMYIFKVDK